MLQNFCSQKWVFSLSKKNKDIRKVIYATALPANSKALFPIFDFNYMALTFKKLSIILSIYMSLSLFAF